jgi:hypothetical protein
VEKLSAYSQNAVNKMARLGLFIHKLFNIAGTGPIDGPDSLRLADKWERDCVMGSPKP